MLSLLLAGALAHAEALYINDAVYGTGMNYGTVRQLDVDEPTGLWLSPFNLSVRVAKDDGLFLEAEFGQTAPALFGIVGRDKPYPVALTGVFLPEISFGGAIPMETGSFAIGGYFSQTLLARQGDFGRVHPQLGLDVEYYYDLDGTWLNPGITAGIGPGATPILGFDLEVSRVLVGPISVVARIHRQRWSTPLDVDDPDLGKERFRMTRGLLALAIHH